jgi:uncharacterized membrane protein (DUF485 family)
MNSNASEQARFHAAQPGAEISSLSFLRNRTVQRRSLTSKERIPQGVAAQHMTDPQDTSPPDRDLTPAVGAETDVARLGHSGATPGHELTADEDRDVVDWDRVAAMAEFRALLRAKLRFIVPATIFFVVYYFVLPVLAGAAPELMGKKVWGKLNVAYLFALSQFVMSWVVAGLYLRAAARFDKQAADIIGKLGQPEAGSQRNS